MVNRPEVLAIVQARGGSKGLPQKNVRPLAGYPLVAYSVASGLAAQAVTRTIISTDDPQIAEIAKQYGAEVPFMRPPELAADDAPDFPLFQHALRWLEEREGYRPEIVVQLRPTTPLRPRGMIDAGIRLLLDDPQADSIRSVTPPQQTPYKMWRKADDGYLTPLLPSEFAEPYNMPRQKLPSTLWQTGHLDVIRATTIQQKHSLTGGRVRPLVVDSKYCVDIDRQADFVRAEQIIDEIRSEIDMPGTTGGGRSRRQWPDRIDLVVFDFDGVFTDNRVVVLDDAREAVVCNRGDGMGLELLRKQGVAVVVLSTETNPVVTARCRKLNLDCEQGLADKGAALKGLAQRRGVALDRVIYVGNDVNDMDCLRTAGFSMVVADAHLSVLGEADLVLSASGGYGAVREACDRILDRLGGLKRP